MNGYRAYRNGFEQQRHAVLDCWDTLGRHIPTQQEIDNVAERLGIAENFYKELYYLKLPPGIELYMVTSDCALLYWAGSPAIQFLIKAGLEDLPRLLTCTDSGIRKLAVTKLEVLTGK